jgi:hypothetical protein
LRKSGKAWHHLFPHNTPTAPSVKEKGDSVDETGKLKSHGYMTDRFASGTALIVIQGAYQPVVVQGLISGISLGYEVKGPRVHKQ